MSRPAHMVSRITLLALLAASSQVARLQADDFRIVSQVYVEDQEEPVSENLTLFQAGVVYDFLKAPEEITIFDPHTSRFVLLDVRRKVRAEVSTGEIYEHVRKLRELALAENSPLQRFHASPEFAESYDEASGRLDMDSAWIEYHVRTIPARNPTVSSQYHDFSDWYARLNSLTRRGAPLPFARVLVNEALHRHGRIPAQVNLTLLGPNASRRQRVTLRSEHDVEWKLRADDRRKIERAARGLVEFTEVNLSAYSQQ